MNYRFKQRKGSVHVNRRIVNARFDATQVETITITRRDGREFKLVSFWDWTVSGDKGNDELLITRTSDLRAWLSKHSLPSLEWIQNQIDAIERSYSEDPMGHPSQYI